MIIEKEYEFIKGKNYNEKDFNIIIEDSQRVYLKNKNHLLLSFHKNAIDNDIYFPLIEKNYTNSILSSCNRKTATGENCDKSRTPTGILGYMDCLTPYQKTLLHGINQGARKTKFLRNKYKNWLETLCLYKDVDKIFKKQEPKYYMEQKKEYNKILNELKIPKTNFTTITVNRNFRTATHTDKGDLQNGLSCIVCIGNDHYKGGFLGFPKQSLLVKIKPGDVIFMDSHQPHCNTELITGKQGIRFSLVCFIREKMKDFTHLVEVNNETFYLTENDFHRYSQSKKLI